VRQIATPKDTIHGTVAVVHTRSSIGLMGSPFKVSE
jgi:hypothetical protein